MRKLILVICTWQILIALALSLAIENHRDEVIIDEYPPQQSEIYIDRPLNADEEAELEPPEMSELPFEEFENLRTKRSVKYKILESRGLHSHFRPVQDENVLKINPHRRRYRRSTKGKSELHSDEVEDVENSNVSKNPEGSDFSVENIPQAQKQTMNPAHYRSDDSRLMDKWVKAPYGDFQARSHKEEEDSQGESSSNVGIKTRTPRVNFITQQGQSSGSGNNKDEIPDGPEARERERERERDRDRDQQNNSKNNNNNNNNNNNKQNNNDDGYRKPVDRYNNNGDRYYPSSYNKYDTYDRPAPAQYPQYPQQSYNNPYYNREYPPPSSAYNPYYEKPAHYDPYYDRYHERNGILPPAGLSRMTPPGQPSSSFYYRHQYNEYDDYLPRSVPNYYYSDKRFDMPMEPRDNNYDSYRPYLYNNEVNNRPGRIVYYANLPDVVRTPNNNYRSGTARYADPYNYYYDRDEYNTRTAKAITYRDIPPSTTMRVSSTPVRSDTARSYYG